MVVRATTGVFPLFPRRKDILSLAGRLHMALVARISGFSVPMLMAIFGGSTIQAARAMTSHIA
jgi:hypothetical protein